MHLPGYLMKGLAFSHLIGVGTGDLRGFLIGEKRPGYQWCWSIEFIVVGR
jgi:hypothetical protein